MQRERRNNSTASRKIARCQLIRSSLSGETLIVRAADFTSVRIHVRYTHVRTWENVYIFMRSQTEKLPNEIL